MADLTAYQLPLWQLPVFIGLPLIILAGLVTWLRHLIVARSVSGEEPNWSVPALENEIRTSMLWRWDVRCKIITMVIYCFAVATLKHPLPALIAIGASILVTVSARVSAAKVLMRLLAIVGFITMFLVVMPFTVPNRSGDTVLIFQKIAWLSFNLRGLTLAATIAAKAVAITLLMEPLIATAPLPVTLYGLSKLGVPEMVSQMVLLSYRYLHVFRHEAHRMASGMQVRGFHKRSDLATLKAAADFLGMLLVRSFERTERVFEAMRARGYQGHFPEPVELHLSKRDLVFSGVWFLAGAALVAYDRLGG